MNLIAQYFAFPLWDIKTMSWLYLVMAGIFEIGFATSLKMSEGFTKLLPCVAFVICSILSLWLLTLSMKTIPIGTSYAVWTGIGAFGTAVIGMAAFGDPVDLGRVFFLTTLVLSLIGLKMVSPT
jgi:quaternary ammonium compound-resistance protein SugE